MDGSFFRTCNTCKGDIDFGASYYVCSVSTCRRKATDFAFCSSECWEAHVPLFRHRDSWAEELQAPTGEDAAEVARAEAPTRVSTPVDDREGIEPTPIEWRDRSEISDDVLVVVSKLKAYIRDRSGMKTSDSILPVLSESLRDLCDEAISRAAQAGRKTILDRDF